MAPVPREEQKQPVSDQIILLSPCKNVLHILGLRLFTIVLSRKEKHKGPPCIMQRWSLLNTEQHWKWDCYLRRWWRLFLYPRKQHGRLCPPMAERLCSTPCGQRLALIRTNRILPSPAAAASSIRACLQTDSGFFVLNRNQSLSPIYPHGGGRQSASRPGRIVL